MRRYLKNLPSTVITAPELRQAVELLAGRGTIEEHFCRISVRVPFYRVRRTQEALRDRISITIALDVQRLSLLQHFTLWAVCELPLNPESCYDDHP